VACSRLSVPCVISPVALQVLAARGVRILGRDVGSSQALSGEGVEAGNVGEGLIDTAILDSIPSLANDEATRAICAHTAVHP
jgi:hypothetical protein